MEYSTKTFITVQAEINAPVETVWKCWISPEDIIQWNFASDDWHTTRAESDFRVGGEFLSRMEAKDGSFGFDFFGTYQEIKHLEFIETLLGDGRTVKTEFQENNGKTNLIETFEAESVNPIEMQQFGWQAILNNFKKHVETIL